MENITVLELKAALTKSQKWWSPGNVKVPNFWLNTLSLSHVAFTSLLNEIMQNPEKSEWACEGTAYLLAKNNDIIDPKNYQRIACITTTYKLLAPVLTDRTYLHLEQAIFFYWNRKDVGISHMFVKTNLQKKWYWRTTEKKTKYELCMDWLQKSIW